MRPQCPSWNVLSKDNNFCLWLFEHLFRLFDGLYDLFNEQNFFDCFLWLLDEKIDSFYDFFGNLLDFLTVFMAFFNKKSDFLTVCMIFKEKRHFDRFYHFFEKLFRLFDCFLMTLFNEKHSLNVFMFFDEEHTFWPFL